MIGLKGVEWRAEIFFRCCTTIFNIVPFYVHQQDFQKFVFSRTYLLESNMEVLRVLLKALSCETSD